jgi:predicted enzyme related to lactoylglutathione lyase
VLVAQSRQKTKKGNILVILSQRLQHDLFFTTGQKLLSSSSKIHIKHIDHLVLTVRDIEITCEFYRRVLGMQVIQFGFNGERNALQFGHQKINLHQKGQEYEPKAKYPTAGSADLCFIAETPILDVVSELQSQKYCHFRDWYCVSNRSNVSNHFNLHS